MGYRHMELQVMQKETTFKDVDIAYAAEVSVCFECGLEAGQTRGQSHRQSHGQSCSQSDSQGRHKETTTYF